MSRLDELVAQMKEVALNLQSAKRHGYTALVELGELIDSWAETVTKAVSEELVKAEADSSPMHIVDGALRCARAFHPDNLR